MDVHYGFNCYSNASLNSFSAINCIQRNWNSALWLHDNPLLTQIDLAESSVHLKLHDNSSLTSLDLSGLQLLKSASIYNNALETLSVAGCSSLSYLYCSEDSLETLYASDAGAFELRVGKSDARNSLVVRDEAGSEIATNANDSYVYFSPGSVGSNPITIDFYSEGTEEPIWSTTIIVKDFDVSQSVSFTGLVDVAWARPWGIFKTCSTTLKWTTDTDSTVLLLRPLNLDTRFRKHIA